jgi:large subunit ribosomal protein L30e
MTNASQEIKDAMKEKKVIIGSRTVMKGVKRGHINSVIYASNCPQAMMKDLEYYSKNNFVAIKEFGGNSLQLGEVCGKPFNVLVIGIKR